MTANPLTPQWSFKIDFQPDTSVTTSQVWSVGIAQLNPPEAVVGIVRYLSQSDVCLWAIGDAGQLTFTDAQDCTQIDGGTFSINGSFSVTNPWDISDFCSQAPPELPCCAR